MNTHYCETCKKTFKPMGIARHRAMHRDKKQDCIISINGWKYKWNYSTGQTGEYIK